jgi:hypothetical protein
MASVVISGVMGSVPAAPRRVIETGVRELRRRARVHGAHAHDRRFADTEHEPDGEKCAEHAGRELIGHSI